jgi:TolA-binding protein
LFKDVIGRFPQHQKAPDALLKTVMCYDRLQDKDNAVLHLRILSEDYPRSEAARRAKSLNLS